MIVYVLFALVATPILAVPVTENAQQTQVQTQVQKPAAQQENFPVFSPGVYSVSEFLTPKGKTPVVQVPIEPDALVIPYPNKYSYYPTVGYRTPAYQHNYYSDYPQYPNKYHYEPFLVVPVPNIPREAPVEYYPHLYKNYQTPSLLYYLSKYQYNQYGQQQQQKLQVEQVQQQSQVAEKSGQQVTQAQQVVPQVVPVAGQNVQGSHAH